MSNMKIEVFLLILVVLESCNAFFIINAPEINTNVSKIVVKRQSRILNILRTTKSRTTKLKTTTTKKPTTEYDWGQHTGSRTTYDWGQHTPTGTQQPSDNNSTQASSATTYDWGQHTGSRTTYDWGQHTPTGTQQPGDTNSTQASSATTYDWGQHTGSRTTYDWGQHTPTGTQQPGDNNSTENPNEGNEYRCAAGKYTCKGTIGLCISLDQICDGKQDCPHLDDEDKKVCFPGFGGSNIRKKNYNSFAGTGFQFHIRNLVIKDGSDTKLFNQNSDNVRAQ